MQEEFENLCFIAVLMNKKKLWPFVICSSDTDTVVRDRSFFKDFVFVCGKAK